MKLEATCSCTQPSRLHDTLHVSSPSSLLFGKYCFCVQLFLSSVLVFLDYYVWLRAGKGTWRTGNQEILHLLLNHRIPSVRLNVAAAWGTLEIDVLGPWGPPGVWPWQVKHSTTKILWHWGKRHCMISLLTIVEEKKLVLLRGGDWFGKNSMISVLVSK